MARAAEVDVAGWAEAVEAYFERGWTDGLPVVPATAEAIRPFLAVAGLEPGDIVLTEATRRRSISAEKVAINAVMAGCRPEYMPVLLAALEAMADPAFTLHGAITSTGGSATLVVVNGPIRQRLGFNAGGNVFGPGWRANATLGRAIRLITLNCLGAQPGLLDRSTQGHPGKYSYCIAELEEANPWEPLHVTRGLPRETSAVTVFAAEGPHNVLSHYGETAEAVVVALADAMAGLGSFSPGRIVHRAGARARADPGARRLEQAAPARGALRARPAHARRSQARRQAGRCGGARGRDPVGASRAGPRGHPPRGRRGRRRRPLGLHPVVESRPQLAVGDPTDPRPSPTEPDPMTLKILDPMVAADEATDVTVAKRVGDLDGKVLGLLHNGKVNGDRLLDLVREQLAARYRLRDVVVVRKPSASRVAEPDVLDRLARECDAVVTAIGD